MFSLSSSTESGKLFNNSVTDFLAASAFVYNLKVITKSFLIKYANVNTTIIKINVVEIPTVTSPIVYAVVFNLIKQFNVKYTKDV